MRGKRESDIEKMTTRESGDAAEVSSNSKGVPCHSSWSSMVRALIDLVGEFVGK